MAKPSTKLTAAMDVFQNEHETRTIDNLTLENRLDRITISGDIDITLDKDGYERIVELKRQVDAIASYMKSTDLPDKITIEPVKTVENPFNTDND